MKVPHKPHRSPHSIHVISNIVILFSNEGIQTFQQLKKGSNRHHLAEERKKFIIHRLSWETQPGSRLDDPESQNIFEFYYSWWDGRTGWAGWETWLAGCVDCCPPLSPPACCKTSSHLQTFAGLKLWRAERWLAGWRVTGDHSSWWLTIVL